MLPDRQKVAFPTVANIRKGTPRFSVTSNGRKVERMGKDLKNKFRVEFLPGTQKARAAFHEIHAAEYIKYPENFLTPDGYELPYIQARIPTTNVFNLWTWKNVTYNAAGMKIAEADGEKYIMRKDPITMEYIVKNGEPYEKFSPKDVIQYEREGRGFELQMKSEGRLLLFLAEVGQMVSFELKTTSYIDCLLIDQNLRAIQGVADFLNGGVAGGIPLDIYRVEMNSPWHKDGVSHKGKQWFIQIKANDLWAKSAITRMSKYALGDGDISGMLQPPSLEIPELPEGAYIDSEEESEDIQPEEVSGEELPPIEMVDPMSKESITLAMKAWNLNWEQTCSAIASKKLGKRIDKKEFDLIVNG